MDTFFYFFVDFLCVMHIKMHKIIPVSGNRQGKDLINYLPLKVKGEGLYQGETVLRQLL